MQAPIGLWPRIIAFLVHTVGATAHPDVHYTSRRTSAIISTLFIAIGIVECLFGHTPYTLIFNTTACAIMIWVALQDQFFSPKGHNQMADFQPDQEKRLEADWTASSKKLESELQNLERKVSANVSTSSKQHLGSYLETIRGKMQEDTKGCERIAGVIKQLREQHKKVDTGYLGAYHEKLEECTKDANNAARKASIYLASFEGEQQGASLQQADMIGRTGNIAGYLESHVGQLLQLIERIRVPTEPIEERPSVLRLGRTPIIIQGLAHNNMFIQQLDENRAVISTQPLSAQTQPLCTANGF